MRVLHLGKFYPPHRGGIETHLESLCRELAKSAALEVIVANHRRGDETEVIAGMRVRRLHPLIQIAGVPICVRMVQAIQATPADIVHLHAPNPLAMLAFLLSGHPGRLVVSWHSDVVRQRFLSRIARPIEQAAVRRAAALVASSPNYVNTSPTLRSNRAKCHVIPLGIDPAEFRIRDEAAIAAIRKRYGTPLVLGVGRLVYYKGFAYAIRAMKHVRGNLLIAGDGLLRTQLEREARRAGVADRVDLLGDVPRDELRHYYHAADVFILPSIARSEAFGIVQLEAMAAGRAVVNTRLASGVPFVSVDGESGITVEPAAPDALGAAVNRLLENPELRARYEAGAQRRVRERFGLAAMVARTLKLYEEVLAGGAARDQLAAAAGQSAH